MDTIWTVTNKNLPDFIISRPVVVLYFWTRSFTADRYMRDRLGKLSKQFPHINIGTMKADEDAHRNIASMLNVRNIPTTIFFAKGKKETVLTGQQSLHTLNSWVYVNIVIASRQKRLPGRHKPVIY
jgi:thioredoxin-like negative regulator of GroEL